MDDDFSKPNLKILHVLKTAFVNKNFNDIKSFLQENEMGYLYKGLCENNILPDENKIYSRIIKINDEKINKIKNIEDDDKKRNINRELMIYYSKIGDLDNMIKLNENFEFSTSTKMDILLCQIRLAFILRKEKIVHENILKGQKLVENNCDWDRKNKFKLYQAFYCMLKNEFDKAAELFAKSLATFQCEEMFSYEEAVNYAIFCALLSFDRKKLEEKILKSTDVIEVKIKCRNAFDLAHAIHNCDYRSIFPKLVNFCKEFENNLFLSDKLSYFIKEIKILVYNQLLTSYSSIKLEKMAAAFLVSEDYLENDLNEFIVSERLNCMIDKIDKMVLVRKNDNIYKERMSDYCDSILNYVERQINK